MASSLNLSFFFVFFFFDFLIENIIGKLYNIQNSKLCFRDMKIMSRRNGGDSVNNESAGRVVYQNHHHS